jgi:hypothetical protein
LNNKNVSVNKNGDLTIKNLSAYWIPELTIHKEIGGTHYIVFGTYEGDEPIVGKLERIIQKTISEKMEETE